MPGRRHFLAALTAVPLAAAPTSWFEPLSSIEHRVFNAINFQRVAANAEPLTWDQRLCETARDHSRRMLAAGFFGHHDPSLGDLNDRLQRAGIVWGRCGENVFREQNYPDPVSIAVVEWMYSDGHRQNLLNPDFTRTGIGVAASAKGIYTVTQQFLTPPLASPPVYGRNAPG